MSPHPICLYCVNIKPTIVNNTHTNIKKTFLENILIISRRRPELILDSLIKLIEDT